MGCWLESKISANSSLISSNMARTRGSKCSGMVLPSPFRMMSQAVAWSKAPFVDPLAPQGVILVGQHGDLAGDRNGLTGQAIGIAAAIPAFLSIC